MTESCDKIASESKRRTDQDSNKVPADGRYLIRLETSLDPLSLLGWLKNQTLDTKVYWASRESDLEIAAVGIADSIDTSNTLSFEQALSIIEARLKESDPGIRYYGGRSFDTNRLDASEWEGFDPYRFIVPKYEIVREDNAFTLAQNIRVDSETHIDQLTQKFQEFKNGSLSYPEQAAGVAGCTKSNHPISREDVPCQSEWLLMARQLVQTLQAGDIEKVVLAHKAELTSDSAFNPVALLERMSGVSSQTYSFLFQFPESGVFLGSSPECLFEKDGKDIKSEAIAGTRPMSQDPEINRRLQETLFQSEKELQEHRYVADNIYSALGPLCQDAPCVQPRAILKTATVQHLCTRFQGKLAEHVTVYDIIKALHPTAAVNGIPSEKAMDQIRSLEPFCRGWYAGPVGWILSDRAEFAVAIRSALIQNNRTISVYSGAGFVKESDPEQEWAETELKKRLILEAVKEII